ncbi:MAG TPA: PepSY domain-containing protein [Rubrivivax sp.]|nr:PepSY domain-containing protein [Rubrivivax sp.]
MSWRQLHRWLGLVAGSVALLLGLTGTILAWDPVRDAWSATPAQGELPVSVLAERVAANVPGAEEIRRLPSGDVVVYAFDAGQPQALRIDAADGRVLGPYETSAVSRWFKNLHRSFLLGDAGRVAAALVALAMFGLSASGLTLLLRRLGGWRKVATRVRGTTLQRIHVLTGRVLVAVLLLTSLTALYMSAATFGLVSLDAESEPDVVSAAGAPADLRAGQLPLLQSLRVQDLRRLNLPAAADPEDTWKVATAQGRGWIDRGSGHTLAWVEASSAQRVHDWAMLLHTGEGAWVWAIVLGLAGASIPLFWATGLLLWWQTRRRVPRIDHNSAVQQAEMLIFVASESGATWGFAQALHEGLVRGGHKVHSAGLEHFQATPAARQIFVLAATYGDGQAPAHAAQALARIARAAPTAAPVTVLGFGDRQFSGFCAYAEVLEQALRSKGWAQLLPLERIHQQSAQEFVGWGEALAAALGEPLALDYRPRLPATTALTLLSREDYPGGAGEPAVILRFGWPAPQGFDRLRGRGLARFVAGDLLGVLAPGSNVPRYYSLASARRDGFVEICVRKLPGGVCSNHLHALQPGERIAAFVQPNPGFVLEGTRRPVLLIGAGTGVAPLAGFIRGNRRQQAMHLYFGARNPALDYYFGPQIEAWLRERRLASLRTVFSRSKGGGGYVQDALQRDAARLRELFAKGAIVRVCGSRPMALAVRKTLDSILGAMPASAPRAGLRPARLPWGSSRLGTARRRLVSVAQLKAAGRYAEDIF